MYLFQDQNRSFHVAMRKQHPQRRWKIFLPHISSRLNSNKVPVYQFNEHGYPKISAYTSNAKHVWHIKKHVVLKKKKVYINTQFLYCKCFSVASDWEERGCVSCRHINILSSMTLSYLRHWFKLNVTEFVDVVLDCFVALFPTEAAHIPFSWRTPKTYQTFNEKWRSIRSA